jgi:hypothetical protein
MVEKHLRNPPLVEALLELEAILAGLIERLEERPVVYSAQLLDLGDPRYALVQPLLVTIESHPDEVVASVPEYNLYATGASDAVAMMNLKAEIVSTYEHLEALGADRLGPMPRQWLASMRKAIEPTDG